MRNYKRTDRVSALLRREISVIIDHDLRDTLTSMATVTGVDVARDLKTAKVYVSILAEGNRIEDTVNALNNAASFIRSKLRERVVLKYLPALTFYYDSSTVNGMYIDKLLNGIKPNMQSD